MYKEMEASEWVEKLKDRLAVIADMSFVNGSNVSEKRALVFNRNKSERTLKVGDMVLLRTPGIQAALQAAWEGPFVVDQVISRVTYKVRRVEGDSVRTTRSYMRNVRCAHQLLSLKKTAKWQSGTRSRCCQV